MVQYKSNTFHYAGIGKESVDGTAVAPTSMLKYQDFTGNAQIETESDEGHVGARGKGSVISRLKAYAEPEIVDRIRWDGGIEEIIHAFCGDVTTTAEGTTGKKHVFSLVDTLPTYTITHGYNVGSETARTFAGAVGNSLEFNFSAEESPTVTAGFLSDFPKFGAVEPSLTYSTTPPAKPGQLTVYSGTPNTVAATEIPGYTEGSVSLSNNFEASMVAGMDYGTIAKDMGDLTVEGSYTVKYTADDQRLWATGSSAGTVVSPENYARSLRWAYLGPEYESGKNYSFILDVPNAEITEVTPSEGGDGSKTFEYSFEGQLSSTNVKFGIEIISKKASL